MRTVCPWPYGQGLFLVRSVRRIGSGFAFRETPHGRSINLGHGVLGWLTLGIFLDRSVVDLLGYAGMGADDMPLQKSLDKVS